MMALSVHDARDHSVGRERDVGTPTAFDSSQSPTSSMISAMISTGRSGGIPSRVAGSCEEDGEEEEEKESLSRK